MFLPFVSSRLSLQLFLHNSAKSGAPPTPTPLYHLTWCTVASSVILGSSVIIGYIIKSLNGVAPYYAKPQ